MALRDRVIQKQIPLLQRTDERHTASAAMPSRRHEDQLQLQSLRVRANCAEMTPKLEWHNYRQSALRIRRISKEESLINGAMSCSWMPRPPTGRTSRSSSSEHHQTIMDLDQTPNPGHRARHYNESKPLRVGILHWQRLQSPQSPSAKKLN
jgi:hypothetical protein